MLERIRQTVWKIPRGKVATYGEVARAAGYPGAARQVVWALHQGAGGLPWHRVVGAGGRIRLPGDAGLEQRARLEAERVTFRGNRIDLEQHGFDFKRKKSQRALGGACPPAGSANWGAEPNLKRSSKP
jgi:methylated-DNA-protein-cysteine methyltransferase related protein